MHRQILSLCAILYLSACDSGSKTDVQQEADVSPSADVVVAEAVAEASIWPKLRSPIALDPAIEARIDTLMASMSLQEKVGQILQPEIQFITPEEAKQYHIGSILNGGGSFPGKNKHSSINDWVALADSFYLASMDESNGNQAIPIIWGSDAVHGHNNVIGATLFPHNIGLGATNNPDLIEQIGSITAKELLATGIDWTFAPTLAVAQNDRWGRTYESYSEDPRIVESYATAIIKGLQGAPGTKDFLDDHHVLATAKHFLADGGTQGGTDQGDTMISEQELHDIHAAGYKPAIENGIQTSMASFSSWNGQKMHGNEYLLTGVLKGRYGLDGFIVGDWNGHAQVPGCSNASCPAAFNAGVDLFMVPEHWRQLYENTLQQVQDGEISMQRLEDAVRRILRVKLRAGLFEKGLPSTRPLAGDTSIIGHPEHRAVARQAVRESLVLLKNDDGLLPLSRNLNILVAGDGADNIGKQSGGWTISWQGDGNTNEDFPGGTSILDGIRDVVEGAGGQVTYALNGDYDVKPDVAIVVFGEDPYAEGHGNRPHLVYQMPDQSDFELLAKLKADGVKVVSVFLSGRPLWVNPELNASAAFVAAWLPGSEGVGISDVLFRNQDGEINYDFNGRLSFSWPKTGRVQKLNPHHPNYDPLFELGYGLTYESDPFVMQVLSEDPSLEFGTGEYMSVFEGRLGPGLILILGKEEAFITMAGARTEFEGGGLTLSTEDKSVQEDARRAVWSASDGHYLSVGFGIPSDLSRFDNGALSFSYKVNERPTDPVLLSMVWWCVDDGCVANQDLTDLILAAPIGEWQVVSVALSCFADKGFDSKNVIAPFGLATVGQADLSFADISLHKTKSEDAICLSD